MFQPSLISEPPLNVMGHTTIIQNAEGSRYLEPSPVNYIFMLPPVDTHHALTF